MNMLISIPLFFLTLTSQPSSAVREVKATSCESIRVNLAMGLTTQIIFDQEPHVTLYADQRHFIVNTNETSKRTLAIIPVVTTDEIQTIAEGMNSLGPARLADLLDQYFRTNLFVFFKNQNQLLFELRFVPKNKADLIVKVEQVFKEKCSL